MKVAFCIPGNNFSGHFLENWTALIKTLPAHIEWKLFRFYHPIVHKVRDHILQNAKQWKPDFYMWIDSDIMFTPDDFYKLLDHNESIVSGLYYMQTPELLSRKPRPNGYEFACHAINGSMLTTRHIQGQIGLIEVKSNGMGWMLIKSIVFDNIKNPFHPTTRDEMIVGEDTIFQWLAKEVGFESMVDSTILVGHEKTIILR